jgi:CheY-like chemotaxis protein
MRHSKPVILVVDDEPINLEVLEEHLQGMAYELIIATSGEQAWSMLQAEPSRYSVVILDRMMPGMDGIEVLRKIKSDKYLRLLPVIIHTAAAPEQVAEGLREGAFYYLPKPFQPTVLRAVVATALRDRAEYFVEKQDADDKLKACSLLEEATFTFRTVAEARQIAMLLSSFCPSSDTALMGLTELMLNAVEHGNLGISYEEKTRLIAEGRLHEEVEHRLSLPKYAEKIATACFRRIDHRLIFNISDQGQGFDWQSYLDMSVERLTDNHGRGIAMSRNVAFSSLTYSPPGNSVEAIIDNL